MINRNKADKASKLIKNDEFKSGVRERSLSSNVLFSIKISAQTYIKHTEDKAVSKKFINPETNLLRIKDVIKAPLSKAKNDIYKYTI
ncbi:hypothetical protein [Thermodesulfovibrio hydrogeniphilus]